MTINSTTEGSPWRPPGGTPTEEGAAPAQPFPDAYAPGPSAPGPYPGYGAFRAPGYGPPPLGNGMARGALWTGVGSLVLGFFSFGLLGIAGGIVGLVLGMVALRRESRGTATGSETAVFGMALSLVSIVLGCLVFRFAWPALMDAFEQGWEQGKRP